MEHQFGIIVFVNKKELEQTLITIIPPWEPDDPFCYKCGQKEINVKDKPCPGPSRYDPRPPKVYA